MRRRVLIPLLAASLLGAAMPLQVMDVVRTGLPPYAPEDRRYRLEGEGWQALRVGERLELRREGTQARSGQLEVLEVREDHALARLRMPGETYPLRGDRALRSVYRPLPALPALATALLPEPEAMKPRAPVMPTSGPAAPHRETLYFRPGEATLSPAGREKLADWVERWGRDSRWRIAVPSAPAGERRLAERRIATLRDHFEALGVRGVAVEEAPPEPGGRFDPIHVLQLPW